MRYLAVRPGGRYVDCTTGLGGHSEAIAQQLGDDGRLLCIDQDGEEKLFFAKSVGRVEFRVATGILNAPVS